MKIVWHRLARLELEEVAAYYEVRRQHLGSEFVSEVERAIELVKHFPNGWPIMTDKSRRIRTRRFPYGIVYQVHADHITILAVMHLMRSPGNLRKREE